MSRVLPTTRDPAYDPTHGLPTVEDSAPCHAPHYDLQTNLRQRARISQAHNYTTYVQPTRPTHRPTSYLCLEALLSHILPVQIYPHSRNPAYNFYAFYSSSFIILVHLVQFLDTTQLSEVSTLFLHQSHNSPILFTTFRGIFRGSITWILCI